jgi:hypothetical protein
MTIIVVKLTDGERRDAAKKAQELLKQVADQMKQELVANVGNKRQKQK